MGKLFARRLDDLQKYQQDSSLTSDRMSPLIQELQSDTGRNISKHTPGDGHKFGEKLSMQNIPGNLKHGSYPDCAEAIPKGSSQESSFVDISSKQKVKVLVEDTGEINAEREMLNNDVSAQSQLNLSFLTDSSKQVDEKSQDPLSKTLSWSDLPPAERHEGQLSCFGQQLKINETDLVRSSPFFPKEKVLTTSPSSPDSESMGRTDPCFPEYNVPSTSKLSSSGDFRSSKDSASASNVSDLKFSTNAMTASVASTAKGREGPDVSRENQSTGPLPAGLETSTAAGGGASVKTSWGPLLQRLGRSVQQAIQSSPSTHGQEPLTLQHAEAKSHLSKPKSGKYFGVLARDRCSISNGAFQTGGKVLQGI